MNRSTMAGVGIALCALFGGAAAWSEQPPPLMGLVPDHATLSVSDPAREAEWYGRVLGFKVLSHNDTDPDFLNWHLVIPGYRIDLLKVKGSAPRNPVQPTWLQQGWVHVVFHVEDVPAALKTLQALKVDFTVNKDDKGTPIQLVLHDPEGNEVEVRRNVVL